MRGALLRVALRAADLVAAALPRPAAYWLADLAGAAWCRFAPGRRALVTAQLARVCRATGRPASGAPLRHLVRAAFVSHARYYLELLRVPRRSVEQVAAMVSVRDWDQLEPLLRSGAVVAIPHYGNFEPYGSFLATHGLTAVGPIEVLEPPELDDFVMARRGSGRGVELIPMQGALRPLLAALRGGRFVALAADRDLTGDGLPVTLFGHQTRLPSGPAALAVQTGRPLVAAVCHRLGPERFEARAWPVDVPRSGDRRSDIAALTQALAHRFEEALTAAPEQWFGTFQPLWPDLKPGARA
jgi:KDO2-lipid IV(A) lauroyltransferase